MGHKARSTNKSESVMEIKELLKEDLNIKDNNALDLLADGLIDAASHHQAFNGLYDGQYKVIKKALVTLSNRLRMVSKGTGTQNEQRIKTSLSFLPPILLRIMDTIDPDFYSIKQHPSVTGTKASHKTKSGSYVKYYDHVKSEIEKYSHFRVAALTLTDSPDDNQKALALQLDNIVNITMKDLIKPGKGGANKQAKIFNYPILILSEYFKEALPSYEISIYENTMFHDYVVFWMGNFTDWDKEEVSSAKRHIQNALASKLI